MAVAPGSSSDPYEQRRRDEHSTERDTDGGRALERRSHRTTVEFEVEHLWGLHTVRGRFRSFDGAYIVGPGGTEIELTIDAASIDTGVARRDEHLRSPDFFFVALHPVMRFRSTRVTDWETRRARERRAGGGRHDVPLAFDASVRVIDGELEVEATTTVDQGASG